MAGFYLFSKPIFRVFNKTYSLLGSGIVGITLIIQNEFRKNCFLKTLTISSITIGSLIYVLRTTKRFTPTKQKIVLITGCDTGLGFSLAQHVSNLGFTVFAGFLNLESDGATYIKENFRNNIQQLEIDITKTESVNRAVLAIENFIQSNLNFELYGIINNAGVMIFGEFEWFTEELINRQIDVNLVGTLRITKAFIPLLRKYKGRIISVTSHCAQASLPGLAVYGGTKYGVKGWCDSLRVELDKFGVKVVMFIPGSFFGQSQIMAKQVDYMNEMQQAFTSEQNKFYNKYFTDYYNYLKFVSSYSEGSPLMKVTDVDLYKEFDGALLDKSPFSCYKSETLRYRFYHTIFKFVPDSIKDYFVVKFVQLPEYVPDSTVIEME